MTNTSIGGSNYYGGLMSSIATGGAYGSIRGGGSYKIGGKFSNLEEYAHGVFSDSKEKLIRSIAKDVSKSLKIPAGYADTSPINDVISKFSKIVPDPRNNKKIKTSSKMHSEICMNLAKAINKTYKTQIIDEDDNTENICQKVSELLYTLFTGLHTEFLTVSSDVSRIMKNLNIIQNYIDGLNEKLISDLDKLSSTDSSTYKNAYKSLKMEINRQYSYLANLTSGVIEPTKKSLIDLVENNKEFQGLVKDLSSSVGSKEFSDKLSYMLNGSYNVSQTAVVVDKALKKLGMSVSEYKNANGLSDLRSKLYKKLIDKKPTTKNIADLVSAIDIIARSDLSHDDIADKLSKKGGAILGGANLSVDEDIDGFSFGVSALDGFGYNDKEGVFSNRMHSSKGSIGNSLQRKEITKNKLFKLLNTQIKDSYGKITMELGKIAKKMGNEIKITDDIHTFMRQLNYFAGVSPDRRNLHKALSGYRLDSKSQFIKHDFISSLSILSGAANDCAKGNGSSHFKDLAKSIDNLVDLIDGFNQNITKSLSDVHIDADREKMGGGQCSSGEYFHYNVYGGFIDAIKGGAGCGMGAGSGISSAGAIQAIAGMEMTYGGTWEGIDGGVENALHAYGGNKKEGPASGAVEEAIMGGDEKDYVYLTTIKKSIREMEYYYRIANVKLGMSIASSQQKNYTENYSNILGEESAIIIDKINKKHEWLTCTETGGLSSDRETISNRQLSQSNCVMYNAFKNSGAPRWQEKWKGYSFVLEYIRSAKVEMIEASQALDLYLSKFTEEIQNNPDSVKNFLHLLNNLEIVAKWFTDKSGNNLVQVFEAYSKTGTEEGKGLKSNVDLKDNHYYEHVKASLANATASPFGLQKYYENGIKLYEPDVKQFIVLIEKSFKSMRALENVILTFSKIHDANKLLMSPGLMFKAFMKYAVASSLGFGLDKGGLISNFSKVTGSSSMSDLYHPSLVNMKDKITDLRLFLRPVYELGPEEKAGTPESRRWIIDPLTVGDSNVEDELTSKITKSDLLFRNKNNKFLQTEEIYTMSIKSLVSKVFVVIGAYSLFNRPAKSIDNNNAISLRPLRQIMGGASHSEILPEATELYIRLLLLAEWYRELFKFRPGEHNDSGGNISRGSDDKIISMIPAFDGVWSGFIKAVFLDGMYINDGNYTENSSNDIIASINTIYRHYKPKYGTNCCMKILENFVAEVNLRYGLVKRSEIDKYIKDKHKGLEKSDEYDPDELDDSHNLLDYDNTFDSNKIPSRQFQKVSSSGISGSKLRNKRFLQEMIGFRKKVEENLKLNAIDSTVVATNLSSVNTKSKGNYNGNFGALGVQYSGLDDIIRNVKKRLDKSDKGEHFKIIHSTIMGVERHSDIDMDVMLMFHETVVNPLTILYSIYKIVNDWNGFISVFNCGKDRDATVMGNVNTSISGFLVDCAKNYANERLVDKYYKQYHLYFLNKLDEYSKKNSQTLLKDIMSKIMYMVCDKNPLFEVRFSGTGNDSRYPMLSFNALEKHVTVLIECVERSLSKFKKILPHHIIARYEKNEAEFTIENNNADYGDKSFKENVCSLYYIKEHLCDRLIADKYGMGLSSSNNALKNAWLWLTKVGSGGTSANNPKMHDEIFELMYWKKGINKVSVRSTLNYNHFPINRIGLHEPNTMVGDNVQVMAKVVAESSTTKSMRVNELVRGPTMGKKIMNPILIENLISSKGNNTFILGHTGLYDYTDYGGTNNDYSKATMNQSEFADRGLILKFNNLLYNYIELFTDKQSTKLYLPLLQKFASAMAEEVMQIEGIDDVSKNPTTNIKIEDTMKNYVLCKTMSAAIRSIITNKKAISTVNMLTFAEDDLINVPEYMKDTMSAYLPIFDKHLNIISNQAEFIKLTIEDSPIKLNDTPTNSGIYNNEGDAKGRFINVIDKLIRACRALQGCITEVYSELADIPLYFETYKNSIADYKNRNGNLPFMPLSHASHLLNNQIRLHAPDDVFNFVPINQYDPIVGGYRGGGYHGGYHGGAKKSIPRAYHYDSFNRIVSMPCYDDLVNDGYIADFKPNMVQLQNTGYTDKPADITNVEYIGGTTSILAIGRAINKVDDVVVKLNLVFGPGISRAYGIKYGNMLSCYKKMLNVLTGCIAGALENTNFSNLTLLGKVNKLENDAMLKHQNVMSELAGIKSELDAKIFEFNTSITQNISDINDNKLNIVDNAAKITVLEKLDEISKMNNDPGSMQPATKADAINTGITPGTNAITVVTPSVTQANTPIAYNIQAGLMPNCRISPGSDAFVFAYGTRGLFSDNIEPNIKLAPGINNTMDVFNTKPMAVNGGAVDDKLMNDCFVSSVHLLRYATDYIYHKTHLMDTDLDKTTKHFIIARQNSSVTDDAGIKAPDYINVLQNLACQTGRCDYKKDTSISDTTGIYGIKNANDDYFIKSSNIVMLINNDNYKQSIYRMLRCITQKASSEQDLFKTSRERLRIYNILDSNIVPINFHAMQRELPFSNIFNYSYTFDHFMRERFGVIYDNLHQDRNNKKASTGNTFYADNILNTTTGVPAFKDVDQITGRTLAVADVAKERILGGLSKPFFPEKFKYTEDQLVNVLTNPYGHRANIDYVNTIFKLMIGADGISSGRPKYLSDQLWNKVLLNSSQPFNGINNNFQNKNTRSIFNVDNNDRLKPDFDNNNTGDSSIPIAGVNSFNPMKTLTYMSDNNNRKKYGDVKQAVPDSQNSNDIAKIGRDRYDTYLIRNIEWFVHLQRSMRLLMKEYLEWVDDPIVTKSNAVANAITDYKNDNVFDPDDF